MALIRTERKTVITRTYRHCLKGSDIVDTIIENGFSDNRDKAKEMTEALLKHKKILNTWYEGISFQDAGWIYCCK